MVSHIKRLPLSWGSSTAGTCAALRNFSDRQLSALHTRVRQGSLEGSNLNSMHTPMASELTAMSVLEGEKEVKKERKRDRSKALVRSQPGPSSLGIVASDPGPGPGFSTPGCELRPSYLASLNQSLFYHP